VQADGESEGGEGDEVDDRENHHGGGMLLCGGEKEDNGDGERAEGEQAHGPAGGERGDVGAVLVGGGHPCADDREEGGNEVARGTGEFVVGEPDIGHGDTMEQERGDEEEEAGGDRAGPGGGAELEEIIRGAEVAGAIGAAIFGHFFEDAEAAVGTEAFGERWSGSFGKLLRGRRGRWRLRRLVLWCEFVS